MTLDMLTKGQELEMEIFIGESSFLIRTKVVEKYRGMVLVAPYTYNGVVVDFSSSKLKNITFDLHCIDGGAISRRVWKNVVVNLVSYEGKEYYGISTRIFGSLSKSSERRGENRIVLELDGKVIFNGQELDMHAVDISEKGFAFLTVEGFADKGDIVTVRFFDVAMELGFSMVIRIRLLRIEKRGNQCFYAGSMMERPNDLLAYIYYKCLDQKKQKNILLKAKNDE